MSDPTLTNSLLILLGDGATPTEGFAYPCGANANTVKFKNNTGEEVTLDCNDPLGAAAIIQRWIETQDTELSIAGLLAKEALQTWRDWSDGAVNGGVKNIRIAIMNSAADGGGYYTVPAILSEFEFSREGKKQVQISGTIVAAGRRVWTAAT